MPEGQRHAWWTLMQQHFMAFAGLCIPIAVLVAVYGHFPLAVTLTAFLPLVPTIAGIVFDLCMLREFGRDHHYHIRIYDYLRLIAGTPLYQLVLAISALRALLKFHKHDFRWEKTRHIGAHLSYLEAQILE